MIDNILLAVSSSANPYIASCTYGELDLNGWVEINALVVVLLITVAALVYTVGGLMPASMREKIKSTARAEIFQGIIAMLIVVVLLSAAEGLCQVGSAMSAASTSPSYQDPILYAQNYLANLLFTKGFDLFTQIFSESTSLVIWGNIAEYFASFFSIGLNFIRLSLDPNVVSIFFAFSSILTNVYIGLVSLTYGVILIIYLLLPIIERTALLIVVPVAIVMRSLVFTGPRLREAADSILALAIAFYFIFPMTILLDGMITTWVFVPCSTGSAPSHSLCDPYSQFIVGGYSIGSIPTSAFFSSGGISTNYDGLSVPWNFFVSGAGSLGGFGAAFTNGFEELFQVPAKIVGFGAEVAQYLFQGVFLLALDVAITVGFAQGLSKALSGAGRIVSGGSFWGNE